MNNTSEIEIREKLADVSISMDRMLRRYQYETHRAQRKLDLIIFGSMALIGIAFVIGVAIGGGI